ncbi:hypothetical protein MSPP1_002272 [Malassezia sp. CBS 17886]|nr:hypothetical protein MSPP1_002272 [Malassezia sp. CBS 17886]
MTQDFFQACHQGDFAAVQHQLEQDPVLLVARNEMGVTAITVATQAGHVDVVRELLSKRMSRVNAPAHQQEADPREPLAMATPTEQNADAFAMVRDAALRVDTLQANQATPGGAQSPVVSQPGNEGPDASATLPPPEVARMIPCKFFPNCRYGSRCIFQHPTGGAAQSVPQGAGHAAHFFSGLSGMPFSGPGPYGVPPPFMDPMFSVPYGANGVPFFSPPVPMHAAAAADDGAASSTAAPEAAPAETGVRENAAHRSDTPAPHSDAVSATVPDEEVTRARAPGKSAAKGAAAAKGTRSENTNTARARAANGGRPSCAFFARSACRYANDCRFPHVLPDGTDARTPSGDDTDGKNSKGGRRAAGGPPSGRGSPDVSDASAGGKKAAFRNGAPGGAASARGKGARRSGAAGTSGRKAVQRVPNSDEFPALPGVMSDGSADTPKPVKANFSAILSAPAPAPKANCGGEDGDPENEPGGEEREVTKRVHEKGDRKENENEKGDGKGNKNEDGMEKEKKQNEKENEESAARFATPAADDARETPAAADTAPSDARPAPASPAKPAQDPGASLDFAAVTAQPSAITA